MNHTNNYILFCPKDRFFNFHKNRITVFVKNLYVISFHKLNTVFKKDVSITFWRTSFSLFKLCFIIILMPHNMIILYFHYSSRTVLLFIHSTLVLIFYIDVVLTLSIIIFIIVIVITFSSSSRSSSSRSGSTSSSCCCFKQNSNWMRDIKITSLCLELSMVKPLNPAQQLA